MNTRIYINYQDNTAIAVMTSRGLNDTTTRKEEKYNLVSKYLTVPEAVARVTGFFKNPTVLVENN